MQQFWDQGSKFKVKMGDQAGQNIPRYDPEIRSRNEEIQECTNDYNSIFNFVTNFGETN